MGDGEVQGDGAVASVEVGEGAGVVARFGKLLAVPCVGVHAGSLKFGYIGLVDGELEGDGGIAAVGGLSHPRVFATLSVSVVVPCIAGAGFIGNGECGGLVDGEGEHDRAVAAIYRLSIPRVFAAFSVSFSMPGVFTACFVAYGLGINGVDGQHKVYDAVAGARTLDGVVVVECTDFGCFDVKTIRGVVAVLAHCISEFGHSGASHGEVQSHDAVASGRVDQRLLVVASLRLVEAVLVVGLATANLCIQVGGVGNRHRQVKLQHSVAIGDFGFPLCEKSSRNRLCKAEVSVIVGLALADHALVCYGVGGEVGHVGNLFFHYFKNCIQHNVLGGGEISFEEVDAGKICLAAPDLRACPTDEVAGLAAVDDRKFHCLFAFNVGDGHHKVGIAVGVEGDGECVGHGGNHFIVFEVGHAAREDLVGAVVVENNAGNVLCHSGDVFANQIQIAVADAHLGVAVVVEVVIGGCREGSGGGADHHIGKGDKLCLVGFSILQQFLAGENDRHYLVAASC